jgi:hypothetical protein
LTPWQSLTCSSFFPYFGSEDPSKVDVKYIADEIEYLAKYMGHQQ